MIVKRPENYMKVEQERAENALADHMNTGRPHPHSNIGGGRGGSLVAFINASHNVNNLAGR